MDIVSDAVWWDSYPQVTHRLRQPQSDPWSSRAAHRTRKRKEVAFRKFGMGFCRQYPEGSPVTQLRFSFNAFVRTSSTVQVPLTLILYHPDSGVIPPTYGVVCE